MGGTAKNIGRGTLGAVTGGLSEAFMPNPFGQSGPVGRGIGAGLTGGISEFTQKNPFGLPVNSPIGSLFGHGGTQNNPAAISGPFSIDPTADQTAISDLGKQQYGDTLTGIQDTGAAETKRASDLFGQMLPGIAENAQAAHLYDSTGYGQEVARQQSGIASQVAEQEAQQRLGALGGLQGTQTGALQRGLSVEDFVNQANVAKTIGAQMAPQPPSGKSQFGTVASGVGALGTGLKGFTGK